MYSLRERLLSNKCVQKSRKIGQTFKLTREYQAKFLVGGSYMAEHGNRPNFSPEVGNIEYILVDFRKQNYCWTKKFYVFKDGIPQISNPTDIDIV